MSKKEHFVIVPIEIILKDDPSLTHLYCKIYLKEISGVRYSFKDFCIDNDLDYHRAYRLKRLAKKTINTAIANKNKKKQKLAKNARYVPQKKEKTKRENANEKQKDAKIKKQECKSPVQTGVNPPLIETEIELITNYELKSDEELSKMSPSERMMYYAQHYDQFKSEGKI
tara:strand:+ start:127 stop:636 length:510 start_codon:yes stop_codon:yes gene_type:complete